MFRKSLFALVAAVGLGSTAFAQQSVTVSPYMATLDTGGHKVMPGKAFFDVFIMDSTSMAPSTGLSVTASLSMPVMPDMSMDSPKVSKAAKPGHFSVEFEAPHAGEYRLTLHVQPRTGKAVDLVFSLVVGGSMESMSEMSHMSDMHGMEMKSALGPWDASRDGSGTSWQPESSPMFMKMLPKIGGFETGIMGTIQSGYVDAGGERGAKQFFTDSMIMLMGRREVGHGAFGVNLMTSLDPLFNGERGVPDLFQTGETAYGTPLVDRQHPHNLYSEIAASYSQPFGRNWSGFLYGGPVGEPALGGVMFLHRASGMEIPEAPISHHWFDSTHISFGVVTAGLAYASRWKLEGSWFNGHEPGENRYALGPQGLNSGSGRVTYNPGKDWSFSGSYGYLESPESTSPGLGEHRSTLSAAYSHKFSTGDNLSVTSYFGQDDVEGSPHSNAFLLEATLYHGRDSIFARFERVDKDELYNVPAGIYTVNKWLLGDVHDFYSHDQIEYGIGAYAGLYSFPGSLDPYYGRSPVTLGVFFRIRPSQM